jgi:enoyl-CoA hydratase
MAEAGVTLGISAGRALLRIRNPGRRNAFTWSMYDDLSRHLETIGAHEGVKVVIVEGDDVDGFASGTDIRQFSQFRDATAGIRYERHVGEILRTLASLRMPVVGAVRGAAIGAGLAIALSCDLIVAERSATFGVPIVRTVGNMLPANVIRLMTTTLGDRITRSMLLGSELFSAERLHTAGVVHAIADADAMDAAVDALARRILDSAPLSARSLKEILAREAAQTPLPADEDLLALCYGSSDFEHGVRAFLARTRPEWSGT